MHVWVGSGTLLFRKNGVRSVRTRQRKRCAAARLEAGAAKAPQGRRGQVSFGISQVKVLHLMGA